MLRSLLTALTVAFVVPLAAQNTDSTSMPGMNMPGMVMTSGPLGITTARMGSGTSWLPDAAQMRAYHWQAGSWTLMAHGNLDLVYDHQGGPRGDTQLLSTNWFMLMAMHHIGGSLLHLHTMLSAEPFTIGGGGYPLLLQSGESFHAEPLHDHQHPHDLFMELGAMYEVPLGRKLAMSVYAAPVGEPALGPVAYMHRPSAENDPTATIAHHWQDATHITYGVLTAGIYSHDIKVEGSLFNGREPDEVRTNFDFGPLDSWSVRATANPDRNWTLSASYGRLKSPEGLHPTVSDQRANLSAIYVGEIDGHEWASSLIFGINRESDALEASPSVTAESSLRIGNHNSIFARITQVDKTGADLVLNIPDSESVFRVQSASLGWLHDVGVWRRTAFALGVNGTLNHVPATLEGVYGGRFPVGMLVYLRVRPAVVGK